MVRALNRRIDRRRFMGGLALTGAGLGSGLATPAFARSLFGPQNGIVRLSANENPYGPSPKAIKAIAEASTKGAYYPGLAYRALTAKIAEANGLDPQSVVITSGSSSVLQAAGVAYAKHGAILLPGLTFDGPLRHAERQGRELRRIPLDPQMGIDLTAMEAAVKHDVGLVYVCNPNNPTGIALPPDQLRAFSRRVSKIAPVLIDEAYNELTDNPVASSMVDLVRNGEAVIVTRTFSKIFGLAGLRIGYAMAPPELAQVIRRHTMSNSNALGLAAALATYDDEPFLEFSKAKVIEGREIVLDTFKRHEVPVLPSQANFVYADIGRNADRFQQAMRERGVSIRGIYQPYDTWSRVSMGKIEDLETFSRVFSEAYTA
ncbi:MAG: histidinol-phosphate transaminase [Pseudomonadota bacterium]